MTWWGDDYAGGYRAHLPHPCTILQGTSSCMICGGHADRKIHEEPHQRITADQYRAEQWGKNAQDNQFRMLPIKGMHAWDKAAPAGEGAAGNYLRHLRDNPAPFKATNYLKQAAAAARMTVEELMNLPKEQRFVFLYGHRTPEEPIDNWAIDVGESTTGIARMQILEGGMTITSNKEEPMSKYNLTIEAVDLLALAKVVQAIDGGVTGAMVESIEPQSAPAAISDNVVSDNVVSGRVHAEDRYHIEQYLSKVVAKRRGEDVETPVDIEYTDMAGKRTMRTAVPLQLDNGYVVIRDVAKDAVRSFFLQNISVVEGPVID